jgi:hypothetical protein
VRFFRLPANLKQFVPILSTGLDLILASWEFPQPTPFNVKLTRVWLTPTMEEQINYLAKHSRRSATAVVAAALCRAKNSKVRPQRPVPPFAAE